jgi:hypothetical protein
MKGFVFEFPTGAKVGRTIPKTKLYEQIKPSKKLKELFVAQVKQVVWEYKLAPSTINVGAGKSVSEIQVFSLALKNDVLDRNILISIDKAINFPIVFELKAGGCIKYLVAYKRDSESDLKELVTSDYFETEWSAEELNRRPLPPVMDLDGLYSHILRSVIPVEPRKGESLRQFIDRVLVIKLKLRELERLESRLRKTKQFNRQVELNSEVRKLKKEVESLNR